MGQNKRQQAVSSEPPEYKKCKTSSYSCREDVTYNSQKFPFKFYCSLALILSDGYKAELPGSEDQHILLLYEHAYILFNDKEILRKTVEKLLSLKKDDFTFNSVHFNKERDHLFIASAVKCLQDKDSKIFKLFEAFDTLEYFIQHVLYEDIKFARLLPLFHLLYYSNELEISSSPEVFYITDEEELKKENSESSVFDISHNSFLLEDTPTEKAEPDKDEPTEEQFSVLNTQPEPSRSQTTVAKPNYLDLTLPELKALLKKYGYKGSNNRNQIIKKLESIWPSINTETSRVLPEAPSSEQVDLNECSEKLSFKKSELRSFLDEHGCLTSNRTQKNKNK